MKKPKLSSNIMMRREEGFGFLFDTKCSRLFKVNVTAMEILELCDGKNTERDISEHLKKNNWELSDRDIQDIKTFLKQLDENHLIIY